MDGKPYSVDLRERSGGDREWAVAAGCGPTVR
jgi:hypothetical protein